MSTERDWIIAEAVANWFADETGYTIPTTATAEIMDTIPTELVSVPDELDVRKVLLDVVPGWYGDGVEVYAKTVDDVVSLLAEMGEKLDKYENNAVAEPDADSARYRAIRAEIMTMRDNGGEGVIESALSAIADSLPGDEVPTQEQFDACVDIGVRLAALASASDVAIKTTRKAFICPACGGVYADAPVSFCDCMGNENGKWIEGEITCPENKGNK